MTSTLHRMRRAWEDQSRMWNRRIPRFSQVSTIYPMVLIYLSVESWPAKNRNPMIIGRTMPVQPQNDEIQDLKCPTFSRKPQPLIHASRSLSCLRIASSTSRPSLGAALSSDQSREQD